MSYAIGEKVWFRGNEYTVVSEPYLLYGGVWQDATDEDGNTVTLKSGE